MAEYIDRKAVVDIIQTAGFWETEDMEVAITCVEQTPTADVVPVVRCRDCIHAIEKITDYTCFCEVHEDYCDINDYCSYGKRMGGGEET